MLKEIPHAATKPEPRRRDLNPRLPERWDAIDYERGIVTLADTKTGRSIRHVGAPALALLVELPRLAGSPYVFPGRKAGTHLGEVKRPWEAVRHAAGLDDVRLHDLRHSFASVAAGGGLSLPIIGALLGHTDVATTQRYPHLGTVHAR